MRQLALFTALFLSQFPIWAAPDVAEGPPERTCFQTGRPYNDQTDLRSDVAIVYGIDAHLPDRIASWREHGYRIHVMTGVSWGNYQDYLYGRFDGTNHVDEAQTDRRGQKVSHGGDVYYMCPGPNYGKFLSVGVQRALDAGAEAIHLEEPEFWVRSGYSDGFKREWKDFYGEEWTAPDLSPDAQWRASKLKYFLFRRALQQVFDYVQAYNHRTGRSVHCYVPTHSLLNYSHWRIVSPESSLAGLNGCDGYIAQVWTGTSRTPNVYQGRLRERTFETAFLEYGAMQNLVRATGRTVWYLNDPVEDNPNHDWGDYRRNWESTLVASLLQPDVWRYEVMPWPERIWRGRYRSETDPSQRVPIPKAYALELQTVINALNDLNQAKVAWDAGTPRTGVLVSDSLMFERGEPAPSDPHMSHIYGLALPLLKRGFPVTPVQMENVTAPGYLKDYDLLLATYQGMKPLAPDVHKPIADWVKAGGTLVFWDDDSDPYNHVREWWNTPPLALATPRLHLFKQLGLGPETKPGVYPIGRGVLLYHADNPVNLASRPDGDQTLIQAIQAAMAGTRIQWRETGYLALRRGPYLIGAGLDESASPKTKVFNGSFIDLFDPELPKVDSVTLAPGSRRFLLDLSRVPRETPRVLAGACRVTSPESTPTELRCRLEGVADTPGILLLRTPGMPKSVELDGHALPVAKSDAAEGLVWLKFENQAHPRELDVRF